MVFSERFSGMGNRMLRTGEIVHLHRRPIQAAIEIEVLDDDRLKVTPDAGTVAYAGSIDLRKSGFLNGYRTIDTEAILVRESVALTPKQPRHAVIWGEGHVED